MQAGSRHRLIVDLILTLPCKVESEDVIRDTFSDLDRPPTHIKIDMHSFLISAVLSMHVSPPPETNAFRVSRIYLFNHLQHDERPRW